MVDTQAGDRWSTLPRIRRLWTGVLLAPLAWLAHLVISYALADTACAPPALWLLPASTAIAAALAIFGGYEAWSMRQEALEEPEDAGDSMGRGRFMANSGVMLSATFLLVILAQAVPLLFLEPCR